MISFAFAVLFLALTYTDAQTVDRLSGYVRDQNGAAVANASVLFSPTKTSLGGKRTTTDQNGYFVFDLPGPGRLVVEARGFSRFEILRNTQDETVEIVLSLEAITDNVTVTGTETRLEDSPASIVVLNREELASTAAATVDDKLRQLPGFSLFRRAGSRVANPTTQGVSLRGVGASGASRALVLVDGVPLNDPFGGWIYWGRVPTESISQVEVMRGTASDLYGSSAIGGVISIVTKRPARPVLSFETSYGNAQTPQASVFGALSSRKWAGSLAAEVFSTDGFLIVNETERGLIDTPANVRRAVFNPTFERRFGDVGRVFGTASFYDERRENGTPLQDNDTRIWNVTLGGDRKTETAGEFAFRVYAATQKYHQSFSAVAGDRNSETLNRLQRAPSETFGFSGQWSQNFRKKYLMFAGLNGREVRGRSDETVFASSVATSAVSAGGREFTFGAYAGSNLPITSRLLVTAGLRFDRWWNFRAFSASRSLLSTQSSFTIFPNRNESALSPRGSILYRLTDRISLSASAASGFRQPTLNELYRAFRVGNVLTLANDGLIAERAVNGEAGAMINALERRLFVRGNLFCTQISRSIANVTLSVTPTLITRQRQNLGSIRACGAEIDTQFSATNEISFSGGYQFVDSRVVSFPANTSLEGLRVPQVARHQFTFQTRYANPRIAEASVQVRIGGRQFDDDQNMLALRSYSTVDGIVSRALSRRTKIFAAVENIFNSKIESGRTPVLTLAGQRAFRIGIRVRLGGD